MIDYIILISIWHVIWAYLLSNECLAEWNLHKKCEDDSRDLINKVKVDKEARENENDWENNVVDITSHRCH